MEIRKFSVFEALTYGFKTVVDTMKLFFPLFLLLLLFFAAGLAFLALINISFVKDIFGYIPQLQSCKGQECTVLLNTIIFPVVRRHILSLGLSLLAVMLIFTGFFLGYKRIMLDMYDTNASSLRRLFSCFHMVPQAFIAGIMLMIIVAVGLVLLIVPGIYWLIRFRFFPYFIIDKNAGIIESLKQSWHATNGQEWHIFSLMIVSTTFYGITLSAGMMGVLVMPIMAMAYTFAYRKMGS